MADKCRRWRAVGPAPRFPCSSISGLPLEGIASGDDSRDLSYSGYWTVERNDWTVAEVDPQFAAKFYAWRWADRIRRRCEDEMDSQGGGSLFMEDFGQKVDLTRRIREVLVNYPEGTTVLKELVQNADDAGATKICLCLDRRVHGIDSLLSESLAQWQGPALLAYNDSVFSEEDFVSISRIGDSKKQGQAWKTGRFGVGFNSVYHLTDLPSFVSGKYVVLFDPQGIHLPNVSAANPGKRLDYVSSSAISLYSDQFLPYCGFGCDMRRPFSGTLFRFPLRSADQAATKLASLQQMQQKNMVYTFCRGQQLQHVLQMDWLRTGLTVQVNGYFELSSNRRSIWFGADMDRGGRLRSDWNMLLLEDVVSVAFNELLLSVRKFLGPTQAYYSLWPYGSFDEPWNILVQQVYRHIVNLPVVYSGVEGGKWMSLSEAFIHDRGFAKSEVLYEALILLEMPVVSLSNSLVDMLFNYAAEIHQRLVSPNTVRHFLKQAMCLTALPRDYKLVLLEYCLDDLIDADVGKLACGLPLVPLASGEFGIFSESSNMPSYFIGNDLEYELLAQITDILIDRNIPLDLYSRLSNIAKTSGANIGLFSPNFFLHFLDRFMPYDWKCQDIVVFEPENNVSHPSACWFVIFWQYLREQCDDLSIFHEWPIFPVLPRHLCRASKTSRLTNAANLSDTLKNILVKIGCKILNPEYQIGHPQLTLYIHEANGAGILDAIFDAVTSSCAGLLTIFQKFSPAEKDELRQYLLDPKWYLGYGVSKSYINKCRMIPMYRVYSEGSTDLGVFSDLEWSRKFLPPLGVADCLLGNEFIKCLSNSEEDILSRYYGIQHMERALFYKQKVLTRTAELLPEVRDSLMLSILQDLPQLCVQDPSFRETLRSLEFVPTLSENLKCPQVLYDPRNEELYALLEDSGSFPCGKFQDPEVLDMLQSLGLQTSVSLDAVVESARQIELLMHADPMKAYSRGKVLLSYLEVNANKWLPNNSPLLLNKMLSKVAMTFKSASTSQETNLAKFWNDLRMICWCPVMDSPPYAALPWPTATSTVAPPKLVRLQEDMWLVSASMRILDGGCSSTSLSVGLGWSCPPGGNIIAAQLLELGKNNENVTDQILRQELALAMPKIYAILMAMIGKDEMDIVKAILEGSRWIWVGDGFATVDEVVLSGPFHLAPYVRVIPIDLAVFRDFFLELGIRETLKPADYSNILSKMATRNAGNPLNQQELRAALMVVQHLAEIQFQDQNLLTYLPNVSSRLMLASELVYNDAPWLLDSENGSLEEDSMALTAKSKLYKFVHNSISNDVAGRFGVRSLRRMLLAESADSMNLGLSDVAEAFGQHEALTTRLKHILEMYADGPGILFELVQNADDAGASEVVFLLDRTQYGTSSILSPEMADWQGPALYCFNDSVFSPQDLHAISRIGQDSKFEKPFTIGRFGLGFNCVYHFTDIPGFVSGENIVIFDPHACNLPGISPANPGLRIKFVGRTILEQFPDQFSPFLHFGCDLKHPFPGTLFRFPLRNKNAASRSHIKKESYSPEDVCSLFSSFTEAVVETLLFLRNVKTISIFVKDGLSHEMLPVHCVSRHNIQQSSKPQSIDPLLDFIHGKQQNSLDKVQFYEKLSKVVDIDLPWYCEKVVLNEQTPSGDKLHFWIKSECLGGGHAKVLSVTSENRSLNFIPWASVAAYLHSCDRSALEDWLGTEREINGNLLHQLQLPATSLQRLSKFEGRAFCFLPLPISTGLPVHINSYFELSSNRRDIWFGNDMTGCGKVRSDWNISLLEDVAAPAYGYLLAEIAKEIGPCDLYFSFWPTEVGPEPWSSMVRKFYSCITGLQLHILYSKVRGGQWVSAKQAVFPDYTFSETVELSEVLSEAGLPLVSVSQQLVEHFMRSCPGLHFLTPQLLRTLLIRRKRGFKNHDAMILTLKYCLSDIQEPIVSDKLYGLPLLPLATGQFADFTKRGQGEKIFVTTQNEYDLLKDFVPHLLVDLSISEDIFGKLQSIAQAGDSNLSSLTCYLLEGLLIKVLPAEWKQTKQVVWNPGHQGHPSVDWMGLLWTYLKLSCNDLSIFAPWPILPTGNGYLFQIVKDSNVIKDDGWSENMYSLLQKVGCIFLRSDLGIDHPQLSDFVQDASASGVLNAFLAISGEVHKVEELLGSALDGERRELRSFLLQSKWFQGDQMKPLHIDLIKSLPIFETYRSRNFVSLQNPVKWLRPEGLHEDLMDDNFIRSESDREKAILKSYLKPVTSAGNTCLQAFSKGIGFYYETAEMGTWRVDGRKADDFDFKENAKLCTAKLMEWLYDPRVPGLLKLLNRETFFPSEEFLKANALDTLVSFGLQRCLSFKGLLDCARSVSICNPEDIEALHGGKRLLACLDAVAFELEKTKENEGINKLHDPISLRETEQLTTTGDVSPGKVYEAPPSGLDLDIQTCLHSMVYDQSEQEFWSDLLDISWCPVYINPPVEGLPWSACSTRVAPPNLVRPKSQMWLVSFTTRILDGECFSEYLQEKIGWSKVPDISVLSFQLVEISKSYCQAKMQSDGRRQIPDALLQDQIPTLYSKLQEYVGKDDFEVLKSALDGVPWVWIGDNFIFPNALAFDSPVKYHPYLYAVPSELSRFRVLLSNLGVKDSFDLLDYIQVLQRVQCDMNGSPLSAECLSFVHRVLEAVADFYADKSSPDALVTSLLVPDSNGVLTRAADLVYNDAPWMDKIALEAKKLVHPTISNDLAGHLGLQSLRFMSLVNENMTRHLPCMDYGKVHELLELYGDDKFLIFDLLELADCCKATKLHVIFDKRDHPRLSLLQHNLGEFQGPAVTVVLEGVTLSMQEVCNLHLLPPWKLQGTTLTYGLGLLSCYWISNLQVITSGGALYMFDPHGSVLSPSQTSSGKMYSLFGTNLMERFRDQFQPMFINEKLSCSAADSTIIRMPLSLQCMSEGLESGSKRIMGIFENFIAHASSSLLFLKSVLEVSLSTWEEQNSQPCQDFSVHIDPSSSVLRNPFPEKKWRKFQISRLFNSSSPATKLYTIDVHVSHGGIEVTKKWFVVLSLGSGQTRNMALDRRYLSYNLTPVAGIAALISENGQPASVHTSSCILSPLPLSSSINMPVTAVGYFLVCHNGGRHLFRSQDGPALTFSQIDIGNQLIVSWNKELMSCVRDSYVEMILEFQRLKRDPLTSLMDSGSTHAVSLILHAYAERVYSFWPRSWIGVSSCKGSETANLKSLKAPDADWRCFIEQVISPFYARLVAQPVWQLYSGGFVKAEEGMFLSQPESGLTDPFSLTTIYSFIKEHYPVFSVPSDLVREIQSVGISVKEIKPKMVRDLLKASSISTIRSVETYIDVLDYSVCDIKLDLPSSSDAEASRERNTLQQMNMEQLPGTSNSNRDVNAPRWSTSMSTSHYTVTRRASGSDDAFDMVTSLGKALLDFGRGVVEDIGRSGTFSVEREGIPPVAAELKGLPFPTATRHLVKLVLCRVKDNQLVFIPPITEPPFVDVNSNHSTEGNDILDNPVAVSSEGVNVESYIISFEEIKSRYPWLLPLMNRCGIPVYDMAFFNCGAPSCCFPKLGQSLGKTVASKLVIAKDAGYLLQPVSLADVDKDELFSLFSFDFTPHGSSYSREELDLLKILPMFKTVTGTYVDLLAQEQCIVSSGAFFQPYDVRCLSQSIASSGKHFLSALGVPELHNRDILVKFALPGFENKTEHDQEYILMYIYLNWGDLQSDTEILDALKETKFVQIAEENSTELFKPKELLDPSDPLLKSVFAGERNKFPGEKFSADGWLRILKKIGLQTVPQADVMLECARKVEFLGSKLSKTVEDPFMLDSELSKSDVTLEIWSLAGSVVEAILKHFPVLYGNNFCSLLSNIAFVPAEMGLPSIDGKNGGKKVLSSYNNAILLRDWPLAWSCKPIISRRSYLPPEFSWGALHLRSPPTFSTVLRHLQVVGSNSGEETLAHWPTSRGVMSIEEASCEVLKYLDRVWDSLSTSDVSELKKVAFIPVANGTRLVTANCLFVHLQINLSPLAFELPALYLPFVNILKVLGLQEVLSVACAKGLLAHMRKSWGYHSMNPNEFRAVMEILHFICNEAGQDITEESGNELDEAIIPDDGRRLVLARSCVYIDPYGSRFISSIDVSSLRFVHPAIPERICAFLGVKKLSDIVIEELDQQQPIEFVDQIGSVSLRMLKDKIQNKEFHVAVWAMFNSSKNHTDTANGFSEEMISDSLNSLADNLKFVHSIYTRFLLLPKLLDITRSTESHVPGWGHGPGHRALHFVSRSKTVILVAEPPSFLSIFDTIAVAINEVVGVPNSILIGPLLAAPESSLMAILYTLKLGYEKEKIDYGGSEQLLGKEVTPQDTLQVQFHPLRPFYAGEFVAYRPQEHEKLRYGRVPENTRPSAGQALYRLLVETRPGETQSLLSSQIFSFKSVSAADGSTNFERIEMRKAGVTQGQTPQMGPAKTGSTSKELQHSPVSAAELVQAVQDMLSAVGMPMDIEKQTLLQTTLSLQEQLRESQTALLLEQKTMTNPAIVECMHPSGSQQSLLGKFESARLRVHALSDKTTVMLFLRK
ncbi:Sacsin [Nymphaea thermarum]|nr:Sacsin [Nymphaea thermarum]